MLRRKIKTDAKTALCNNWGKAICIMLVFLAVWVLFALFGSVISVALGLQSFQQMFALEGFLRASEYNADASIGSDAGTFFFWCWRP